MKIKAQRNIIDHSNTNTTYTGIQVKFQKDKLIKQIPNKEEFISSTPISKNNKPDFVIPSSVSPIKQHNPPNVKLATKNDKSIIFESSFLKKSSNNNNRKKKSIYTNVKTLQTIRKNTINEKLTQFDGINLNKKRISDAIKENQLLRRSKSNQQQILKDNFQQFCKKSVTIQTKSQLKFMLKQIHSKYSPKNMEKIVRKPLSPPPRVALFPISGQDADKDIFPITNSERDIICQRRMNHQKFTNRIETPQNESSSNKRQSNFDDFESNKKVKPSNSPLNIKVKQSKDIENNSKKRRFEDDNNTLLPNKKRPFTSEKLPKGKQNSAEVNNKKGKLEDITTRLKTNKTNTIQAKNVEAYNKIPEKTVSKLLNNTRQYSVQVQNKIKTIIEKRIRNSTPEAKDILSKFSNYDTSQPKTSINQTIEKKIDKSMKVTRNSRNRTNRSQDEISLKPPAIQKKSPTKLSPAVTDKPPKERTILRIQTNLNRINTIPSNIPFKQSNESNKGTISDQPSTENDIQMSLRSLSQKFPNSVIDNKVLDEFIKTSPKTITKTGVQVANREIAKIHVDKVTITSSAIKFSIKKPTTNEISANQSRESNRKMVQLLDKGKVQLEQNLKQLQEQKRTSPRISTNSLPSTKLRTDNYTKNQDENISVVNLMKSLPKTNTSIKTSTANTKDNVKKHSAPVSKKLDNNAQVDQFFSAKIKDDLKKTTGSAKKENIQDQLKMNTKQIDDVKKRSSTARKPDDQKKRTSTARKPNDDQPKVKKPSPSDIQQDRPNTRLKDEPKKQQFTAKIHDYLPQDQLNKLKDDHKRNTVRKQDEPETLHDQPSKIPKPDPKPKLSATKKPTDHEHKKLKDDHKKITPTTKKNPHAIAETPKPNKTRASVKKLNESFRPEDLKHKKTSSSKIKYNVNKIRSHTKSQIKKKEVKTKPVVDKHVSKSSAGTSSFRLKRKRESVKEELEPGANTILQKNTINAIKSLSKLNKEGLDNIVNKTRLFKALAKPRTSLISKTGIQKAYALIDMDNDESVSTLLNSPKSRKPVARNVDEVIEQDRRAKRKTKDEEDVEDKKKKSKTKAKNEELIDVEADRKQKLKKNTKKENDSMRMKFKREKSHNRSNTNKIFDYSNNQFSPNKILSKSKPRRMTIPDSNIIDDTHQPSFIEQDNKIIFQHKAKMHPLTKPTGAYKRPISISPRNTSTSIGTETTDDTLYELPQRRPPTRLSKRSKMNQPSDTKIHDPMVKYKRKSPQHITPKPGKKRHTNKEYENHDRKPTISTYQEDGVRRSSRSKYRTKEYWIQDAPLIPYK